MPGRYLLDSNTVIGLLKGDLEDRRQALAGDRAFVNVVVLGELYYGAERSNRTEENLATFDRFAAQTTILDCDRETARHYGEIKDQLRKRGRPIPENDIWIAASARQYDLTVVTGDRHFDEIEGLPTEGW